MNRYRCQSCHGIFPGDLMLTAPSPFDVNDELRGCPLCKAPERIKMLCDVEGCYLDYSCGFSTPTGYRLTCFKHYEELSPKGNQ